VARQWYLDASALAKRYAMETGTPLVNHLFQCVPRQAMMCLAIGMLEVVSIFVRKANTGSLSLAASHQALADFRNEVMDAADFGKVSVLDGVVYAATDLIPQHSINATDAIILSSALDIAAQLRTTGDDLVLVASDQRLLRAAQAEGLLTFDPETQIQADLDALLAS
jgi:predicted nucleic acid-binding protein